MRKGQAMTRERVPNLRIPDVWDGFGGYGMDKMSRSRSRTALSRIRMSRPSRPSMGLSDGKSWQASGTLRNARWNILTIGMTTMGTNSLPLAVKVSCDRVDRAGFTPTAKAAVGGIMVMDAPVSTAKRSRRLPRRPDMRAYAMRSPASRTSRYSGTEGYGIAMRQVFVRVEDAGKPPGCDEPFVYLVFVRRMGQEPSAQRCLCPGFQAGYRNQEPFPAETLPDLVDQLVFHGLHSLANLGGQVWTSDIRRTDQGEAASFDAGRSGDE